MAPPSI